MPIRHWPSEPTLVNTRPTNKRRRRQQQHTPPVPPSGADPAPTASGSPDSGDVRWMLAAIMVTAGVIAVIVGGFMIFAKSGGTGYYGSDLADVARDAAREIRGYVVVLVGTMVACTGSLAWLVGPK